MRFFPRRQFPPQKFPGWRRAELLRLPHDVAVRPLLGSIFLPETRLDVAKDRVTSLEVRETWVQSPSSSQELAALWWSATVPGHLFAVRSGTPTTKPFTCKIGTAF